LFVARKVIASIKRIPIVESSNMKANNHTTEETAHPPTIPYRKLRLGLFTSDCVFVMYKYEIYDPREIEEYGRYVGDKQIAQHRLIGTKPEDHIKHLEKYIKMGFQHIYIQSSSPDEIRTLKMYAKEVLPYIRSTYASLISD
jgi:hypothetical protein